MPAAGVKIIYPVAHANLDWPWPDGPGQVGSYGLGGVLVLEWGNRTGNTCGGITSPQAGVPKSWDTNEIGRDGSGAGVRGCRPVRSPLNSLNMPTCYVPRAPRWLANIPLRALRYSGGGGCPPL